jgi:predicted helicase
MDSGATSGAHHSRANHFSASGLFSGLTSFAELEQRIVDLPTRQERGDAFEVFAEAYLATQKVNQAAEVWPDGAVPLGIIECLKLPPKDMGVDGVYRTLGGACAAYQVKFRTGRKAQTWGELSTFIGLADRADLKVLFTNSDEVIDVVSERRDFFCIRGADLDRLTEGDLEVIDNWLRGSFVAPELKTPRPHQAEALDAILKGLEDHDRVTSVMACGTGKTLTALWMAERLDAQRVLVLVPSLALIRQTLHEWLKETSWERPRFLAVCSDPTVRQKAEDEIIVHQADLDFPVSTNPEEVRAFLGEKPEGVQVVFSTYQSAHVVGEAMEDQTPFDIAIFDEAHKTAGHEGGRFAFALEDANLPIAKRVFMTATPRHYDVRNKDKEGDKKLVYSMDVPETYGPIVHTLSFAKAAAATPPIICNYKVIISVVTSDMIDDDLLKHGEVLIDGDPVKARSVANQIALQMACEEHDLRKVFSFHRSVASAKDFTGETSSSIKNHLPSYETLHVNGAMRTAYREKVMQAFRDADRAVISNARCLTEGVDVPAVDVVAFLSPRKSKVDIVQATGRAMRKAEGKECGYLLLPLFLETESGESIEEALERTGFEEAWNVLQAMQEQDAELAEIIREMRVERGRTGGFDDSRLSERVEVLGPEVSLAALRQGIATSIVDQLGVSWDEWFGQLVAYKEKFGDCDVPARWTENPKLASWISTQRGEAKNGHLQQGRRERLNAVGFVWGLYDDYWEKMFAKLCGFKETFGDCAVPTRWATDHKLATWVDKQRQSQRRGLLEADRERRLMTLGFSFDQHFANWELMFEALEKYKELNGNVDVPAKFKLNVNLGYWVRTQRLMRKKGILSKNKVAKLNGIGMLWDKWDTAWQKMFSALENYNERFGDCNVPKSWPENPRLATWVTKQRAVFKRGTLSPERVERLEVLGFVWSQSIASWEDRLSELATYKERYGTCEVPSKWPENPQLATWAFAQRTKARRGLLLEDRRRRLEEIGFRF